MPLGDALRTVLAADTASIAVMEVVDNAAMVLIPGAMEAPLDAPLFWGALAMSLALGAFAAFPLNRWLIAHGAGHALVHAHHAKHPSAAIRAQEAPSTGRRRP